MIVEREVVGSFAVNSYLLACPESKEAALIDPGGPLPTIGARIARDGLQVRFILLTHGHVDHVAGLPEAHRKWPEARCYLHAADRPLFAAVAMQAAMFGLQVAPVEVAVAPLAEGEVVQVGRLALHCWHSPGHSPGHLVFHLPAERVLFSGDLLFARSVGRTDLPGGDQGQLMASLARVMALPEETVVYCGHGPQTRIDAERRSNPYVRR